MWTEFWAVLYSLSELFMVSVQIITRILNFNFDANAIGGHLIENGESEQAHRCMHHECSSCIPIFQ